ncbi:hypothetical protein OG302_41140 [Streptomyces sp. NBC_01283]|uniref:hypothetical protein n=1 Tax=Streptomyces sp. NBC_01283 TaxID=2903812 RepID=UPI00352BE82B|nr:hypothetical protein OG302_41140 [Streptomyces sp. NBC_01283]
MVLATAALGIPKALAAGRDSAPDAPGDRFDLADSGTRLIHEKTLHHATVMQSFAFDELHGHVYAL